MVRSVGSVLAMTFACVFVGPCFAASSPWDGTWKLNKDKSQLTGSTITLRKEGNTYQFENGGKFACDGKEYEQPDHRIVTCEESADTLKTVTKADGKKLWITERHLAAGGNTMNVTREVMKTDGGKNTETIAFTRVGKGSGFAGTWKMTAVDVSAPPVIVMKVDGDSMHFEVPDFGLSWDGKLDGTPAPYKGGGTNSAVMMGTKAEGPAKMVSVETTNGKPTDHTEITLSADGKTMTHVDWSPDKPDEKQTFVFEKQ